MNCAGHYYNLPPPSSHARKRPVSPRSIQPHGVELSGARMFASASLCGDAYVFFFFGLFSTSINDGSIVFPLPFYFPIFAILSYQEK